MKIGIFDSGSGGLTTLAAIRSLLSNADYYYIGDHAHHPYGDKTPVELLDITAAVVQRLADWGAQIIVIACNTATTQCIHALRRRFPSITFVGTEPAIKVAYDRHCKRPLLLATTRTTQSASVQRLRDRYFPYYATPSKSHSEDPASHHPVPPNESYLTILPCPGLADAVESALHSPSKLHLAPQDSFTLPAISVNTQIDARLITLLQPLAHQITTFDAVILGCTHYSLIAPKIAALFPHAEIIDGNSGVAECVKRLSLERS